MQIVEGGAPTFQFSTAAATQHDPLNARGAELMKHCRHRGPPRSARLLSERQALDMSQRSAAGNGGVYFCEPGRSRAGAGDVFSLHALGFSATGRKNSEYATRLKLEKVYGGVGSETSSRGEQRAR